MEWTRKSIMICAFDIVLLNYLLCLIALFVVLNDKLFVWVVITKLNYLLLIYFVSLIIFASI